MTKASVIVPVYNVEKYLPKCLDSILAQTFTDFEVICVNDGSPDNSGDILNEYAKKDKRIKVISQNNKGLSGARNTGLSVARGKYIYFIDSDDWIEPQTLAETVTAMEDDPKLDLVAFGANIVSDAGYNNSQALEGAKKYHEIKRTGKVDLSVENISDIPVTCWNKLFKKELIDRYEISFPERLLYEDTAFFYKYCLHAKKAFFMDKYFYNYLQRDNSIMGMMINKKSTAYADRLKIFNDIYIYYKKYGVLDETCSTLKALFRRLLYDDYHNSIDEHKSAILAYATKLSKQSDPRCIDFKAVQELLPAKKNKMFLKKIKYKADKKITRYFGGIIKKVKTPTSKKFYLLGVQVWSKKRKIKQPIADQTLQKIIFSLVVSGYKSQLSDRDFISDKISKYSILTVSSPNVPYLKYLFRGYSEFSEFEKQKTDAVQIWGSGDWGKQPALCAYALRNNLPILFAEDGFLRSADTWCSRNVERKYTSGISFTLSDGTHYFDATRSTLMERLLNDQSLTFTPDQLQRAEICMRKIVDNYLTKYNHQPIFNPQIGSPNRKKILVIDQSYGDASITKGLADDHTFEIMLDCAIRENPNADIIIKTHPDALSSGSSRATGYYSGYQAHDNIYTITEPINPIALIKTCDKIYVCTTQFGFEGLICGKEVHTFGMPFYAGWGLTIDAQTCARRTNKRTLAEVFYIAYILYSHYINPETEKTCEIEEAMDYLLKLRTEYFKQYNVRNDLLKEK